MFGLWQKCKILFYRLGWSCDRVSLGKGVKFLTPVRFTGMGQIVVEDGVCFGHEKSPDCFSGYILIDARCPESRIRIGKNSVIGNSVSLISFSSSIDVGEGCLLGARVIIVDSDFHPIAPTARRQRPHSKPVRIGSNVAFGFSSIVLKGVDIGSDCFVGAGAVVAKSVSRAHKIWGNPAKDAPIN